MKKNILIIAFATAGIMLAACGGNKQDAADGSGDSTAQTETAADSARTDSLAAGANDSAAVKDTANAGKAQDAAKATQAGLPLAQIVKYANEFQQNVYNSDIKSANKKFIARMKALGYSETFFTSDGDECAATFARGCTAADDGKFQKVNGDDASTVNVNVYMDGLGVGVRFVNKDYLVAAKQYAKKVDGEVTKEKQGWAFDYYTGE